MRPSLRVISDRGEWVNYRLKPTLPASDLKPPGSASPELAFVVSCTTVPVITTAGVAYVFFIQSPFGCPLSRTRKMTNYTKQLLR